MGRVGGWVVLGFARIYLACGAASHPPRQKNRTQRCAVPGLARSLSSTGMWAPSLCAARRGAPTLFAIREVPSYSAEPCLAGVNSLLLSAR